MEITQILYYIIGAALLAFGIWGTVDAIKQATKNDK